MPKNVVDLRVLFGEDVFLSYSRADSGTYAAALANRLSEKGFSCFLDQWDTQPGVDVPPRVLRALARSSMLVIVASPAAVRSGAVALEVRAFQSSRRQTVPISIDATLQEASWAPLVAGAAVSVETAKNLAEGTPDPQILNRIEQSARFRKRNERVRRSFWASALALLLLAMVAGAAALNAKQQATEAKRQTAEAQRQEGLARASTAEAKRQEGLAQASTAEAERQEGLAQASTAEAKRQEALATRNAAEAESRGLAAEAVRRVDTEPEAGLLLAVRGFRRFDGEASRDALSRVAGATRWVRAFRAGYQHDVSDLAFSADGSLLASVERSGGKRLLLWDVPGFRPTTLVDEVTGGPELVVAGGGYGRVRFAPGGGWVVASAADETEVVSMRPGGGRHNKRWAAWNPADRLFAAVDNRSVVFRDDSKAFSQRCEAGEDPRELFFTLDGRYLVAQGDRRIEAWNVATLRRGSCDESAPDAAATARSFDVGSAAAIGAVDIDTSRGRIAVLSRGADGSYPIDVWNLVTGALVGRIHATRDDQLEDVALWPGRDLVVTGGGGGSLSLSARGSRTTGTPAVTIWDVSSGERVGTLLTSFERRTLAVSFSPSGRYLAAGDDGGRLVVWDMTPRPLAGRTIDVGTPTAVALAAAPEGDTAILARLDGTIAAYDLSKDGTPEELLPPCSADPIAARFNRSGSRLFVGTAQGGVCVYDMGLRRQLISRRIPTTGTLRALELDPRERMLLAIETTGRCHRLDPVSLAAKAQPVSLDSHEWGGAMAIHPSSGVLLVGGGFGMTMWDMQSGAVHGSPSLSSVIGMVFSPDGRRLAVWDIENRLSVIDGRDLTRLLSGESGSVRMRALRGHSEPITALAYSPDGQLIGTSAALYAQKGEDSLDDLLDPGERHEIRLWSSANGSQVGLPLATTGAVRQLAFTADGRRLLSLSADGQLVAWDVAPDAWVAHLEAIVLTSEDPPN